MHDEDCFNGVWVVNRRGDRWIAYGDARYRDDVNGPNRAVARSAVRASIADVYNAFRNA